MLDYLNAELFKLKSHKTYFLGFSAVILALEGLLLFLLKNATGEAGNTFDTAVGIFVVMLPMGFYLVVVICDMIFSDQYKHNTLKNEVSYGLPRTRTYLGKLFAAILAAFLFCAAFIVFYLLLSRFLFPVETPPRQLLAELGHVLGAALPLWLGSLAFCHMLLFVMRGSTQATIVYVLSLSLDGILDMAMLFLPKLRTSLITVQSWLLTNCFNELLSNGVGGAQTARAWITGAAWFALSTAAGLFVFQKREIA